MGASAATTGVVVGMSKMGSGSMSMGSSGSRAGSSMNTGSGASTMAATGSGAVSAIGSERGGGVVRPSCAPADRTIATRKPKSTSRMAP